MGESFKPGMKVGKLTIIKDTGKRRHNRSKIWLCQCECGNYVERTHDGLKYDTESHCCPNCRREIFRTDCQKHMYAHNKSGVRGVCWSKSKNCWRVYLHYNRKFISLGCTKSLEEAKRLRALGEEKYYNK